MARKAVKDYPGRFAIMGTIPLDTPAESAARIVTWKNEPGILGLRYTFLKDNMREALADGTLDWLWAAIQKADIPISAMAMDSLTDFSRIAERHSGHCQTKLIW